MENSAWEKGKRFAKTAALAGAMAFSPEAEGQTMGKWMIVTKAEFERQHLDSLQIQEKQVNEPTDQSKLGLTYTDKSGATFYWLNQNKDVWNTPIYDPKISEFRTRTLTQDEVADRKKKMEITVEDKNKDEQVKEIVANENQPDKEIPEEVSNESEEIEAILNDPEIKAALEGFNAEFKIIQPWAFEPGSNKRWRIENKSSYKNPPEEIKALDNCLILTDNLDQKQVVIMKGHIADDFYILLSRLQHHPDIQGLKNYIHWSYELPLIKTRQEKIDHIKSLLVDRVKKNLKELPQYEPLVIAEPEYAPRDQGNMEGPTGKTTPISPLEKKEVKEKDVNLGEDEIEKALDQKP